MPPSRLRQIVDAISMLPDMEHRPDGREAVLAELDIDGKWERLSYRHTHPRPYFDDADDPWDEDEPEPHDETRRRLNHEWRALDWLTWVGPYKNQPRSGGVLDLSSLQAMYKQMYPAEGVAAMATRPHPALSMLRKSDSSDAIEMRVRSWANIIAHKPSGGFPID